MQKFLVVDDHRLFLEGMRHLLKKVGDDIALELSTSVADALLRIDQGARYDLLLLDIELPEMDGFAMIESLNQRSIVVPIIVISSTTDVSVVRRCLTLGASGFINKNSSIDDMVTAIKRVLAGEIALPQNYLDQLEVIGSNDKQKIIVPAAVQTIGERQREVLSLIDRGMSNKQIANILSISEATVKYHIGILFKYLEVRNRTACLAKAREEGLIGQP